MEKGKGGKGKGKKKEDKKKDREKRKKKGERENEMGKGKRKKGKEERGKGKGAGGNGKVFLLPEIICPLNNYEACQPCFPVCRKKKESTDSEQFHLFVLIGGKVSITSKAPGR